MIFGYRNTKGYTLIEVITVMSIIGVLIGGIVPVCIEYVNKAKASVCNANCMQLDRVYNAILQIESKEHSETFLNEMMYEQGNKVCTEDGAIAYSNGHIVCTIHEVDQQEENIPIL